MGIASVAQKGSVPAPDSLSKGAYPMMHESAGKKVQISAEIEMREQARLADNIKSGHICIGIWMQVGPVIRFHMFSVSLDHDTPPTFKPESSIRSLYSSRGEG